MPINGEEVEHASTDNPPFEFFFNKGGTFLKETELGFSFDCKRDGDLEMIGLLNGCVIVRSDDDAIERERIGRERWERDGLLKVGGESGVSPENMVFSGETK